MTPHLIKRLKKTAETFAQAWIACLLTMVQGDLTVLSLYHAKVAAETGTLTAIAYFACSFFAKMDNKWANATAVGLFTAVCDILVHPTHFGAAWTESVVTGIGAGALAIILHNLTKK